MDHRHGLPVLSKWGANAVSGNFAFWEEQWAWAGTQAEFKVIAPLDYAVTARIDALDVQAVHRVRKTSERTLAWHFEFTAPAAPRAALTGGVVFKFDLVAFGSELGEPELLPQNRGWAWGRADRARVEMRFEQPLAALYFERGRKSEVRAFFYKNEIAHGRRIHTATLHIFGDVVFGPSEPERYGLEDPRRWPADILNWEASPVDLSFLNARSRPAGKHGFLTRRADQLVFEDGTAGRFWGTNLTAHALFRTSRDNVMRQARRLSQLGFNLVRIHHHDSLWVDPNVFGGKEAPDTRTLSKEMLDRLDWWIKCLKDEGIYVWLDLHVGRMLKSSDEIDNFHELAKGKAAADLRGYNYVNPSIQRAMIRFNEAYLNHRNSYTGLRYKEDSAIVAVLLTNENDITQHFGNALLPDRAVPKHTALYMLEAQKFAAMHRLPRERVWRSWEPGPSKLFLNDLERRFHAEMISVLREQGVRVPIAATNSWGFNPITSLPALTAGDVVDVHSYGGTGELERSPLNAPSLGHWMAAAQVAGRPLTVSEWNVSPFPVPDRHTVPLYVASLARLQGWAGVMQYAYSQAPLNGADKPSNWHAFNDPAKLATLPAAALMYREAHVQEASTVYAFAPSKDQLFNQSISPRNAVALRTAAERGKLVVVMPAVAELPWLEAGRIPSGGKRITDPGESFIGAEATEIVSDTGELRRNWLKRVFTVDTPRSQAAMGWIGGREIVLRDVDINAATRNATIAVQSLDGNPISQSRRILISLGARSQPASNMRLPFHSEPVVAHLSIRAPSGLKLYPRGYTGRAGGPVPAPYKNGRYYIGLTGNLATYWLVLE